MANSFLQLIRNPLKFRLYLLAKLPAAFFSGVKIIQVSEEESTVSVPYKWFSTNPFRSTYFACLAMAAEMSTGVLAMIHTYKRNPRISMLITGLEATYHKKATGLTIFTCTEGVAVKAVIEEAIRTGEAQSIRLRSVGKNSQGEMVADFYFTWSFKIKTK